MNHHQIEKAGMYKKMIIFFVNPLNSIIWVKFQRLCDEIANFISLNAAHTSHTQQHQTDTKGLTKAKKEALSNLLTMLLKILDRAFVWAKDLGDENLMHLFNVQKSDFTGIAEITIFDRIKNLRDILSKNIDSMVSVQLSIDDLDALNKSIAAYQANIGTTEAAQSHKTIGTKGIEELMEPMDQSLDTIDRLLVSTYSESNADMVKEYLQNRNIDKLPTHHSGVLAHLVDAATGKELEGATMAINGKSCLSDIDGIAEIIKIKPGTYNLSISMDGYTPQSCKIVIIRGKVTHLEIALVKV